MRDTSFSCCSTVEAGFDAGGLAVVAGVQPVIPSEIRNAAPNRYIFFMESSLISLDEIIYKAVEKSLGNTLGCPIGSQHHI